MEIPDFITPFEDVLHFSVIDTFGNRHFKQQVRYVQKGHDFKEENVAVFPNPVHDMLRIRSVNTERFRHGYVFIYDISGSLIAKREYKNGIIDFNFQTLPQGVYVIRIYDGKVYITRRVIKI